MLLRTNQGLGSCTFCHSDFIFFLDSINPKPVVAAVLSACGQRCCVSTAGHSVSTCPASRLSLLLLLALEGSQEENVTNLWLRVFFKVDIL